MPQALRCDFEMGSSGYRYQDATNIADYTVVSGDYLEYEVWWEGSNLWIALDLTFTDASNLRDSGATDQNGVSAHPATNIAAADGAWYYRKISLASRVGRTISFYDFACEMDNAGHKFGRFRNCRITDGASTIQRNIWQDGDAIPTFATHLSSGSPSFNATLVDDNFTPGAIEGAGEIPVPDAYQDTLNLEVDPVRFRLRFSTPRSTFPLVGHALSGSVRLQDPVTPTLTAELRLTNWTRLWNGGPGDDYFHAYNEQSLFPEQMRSGSVRLNDLLPVMTNHFLRQDSEKIIRTWNGIGGFLFIPSFPQLSRKETTWPHAT